MPKLTDILFPKAKGVAARAGVLRKPATAPTQVDQWVEKKDDEYAAQGFDEEKRKKWAERNRQRYAQHLAPKK